MSFIPPASYQRLLNLGYFAIDNEDLGVHWTSPKKWNVSQQENYELLNIPLEPEVQREFESLEHYHEFAADLTCDSYCWHEHCPTEHDEYEIHGVAIFLYTPYAPSFPLFLFAKSAGMNPVGGVMKASS